MASLAPFGEVVVIGFFGGVWITMLAHKLQMLDISEIGKYVAEHGSSLAWLIPVGLIVAYQLGWLVNATSHLVVGHVRKKWCRFNPLRPGALRGRYETIRAAVFQHGPAEAKKEFENDRSVIRMRLSLS